jgi:hypothetical protein
MTGKFFLFMASSFAWKTLIAFSLDPHSPFDKPKTLNYLYIYNNIFVDIRLILVPAKCIQWTYLISAGPVLTLYLVHSHCDKKYVNLSKWLWYQNFYFRQKSQLILGQNISSPPLKNKWSPHHVLTLHAMRNSKKSKW